MTTTRKRRKKPPTTRQRVASIQNLIKARLRAKYGGRSQSITKDRERVLAERITAGKVIRRGRRIRRQR